MSIIRSEKNTDYSMMSNTALRDVTLSAKAKGIYAYLMSLPDDWILRKSELGKHFADGRGSIHSGFEELIAAGYISSTQQPAGGRGKPPVIIYTVHERVGASFSKVTESSFSPAKNRPLLNTNIKLHSPTPAGDGDNVLFDNKQKRRLINSTYGPLADRLNQVIAKRKKVNRTARPAAWADTLRKIVEVDKLPLERLTAVLSWLERNPQAPDLPYCPVIESANSLRQKFDKMERFIGRQQKTTGTDSLSPRNSGRRVSKQGERVFT